jgi:hypothetical protein
MLAPPSPSATPSSTPKTVPFPDRLALAVGTADGMVFTELVNG